MSLQADLQAILDGFCGADAGRSVALRVEGLPDLSVRGSEPRPAASVIKIALAMAAMRLGARGKLDLSEQVPVQTFPKTRYVSILAGFDADRTLSVREICRLALITSDNPMAVHLQGLVGLDAVNELLADIGCGPPCRMGAGFSEAELGPANRANVLTADAALDLLAAAQRDPIHADLMLAMSNNLRGQRIPALLPEAVVVAHKTGSLNGVVNDVGVVRGLAVAFAVAFLTDGQSDPAATSNDIAICALQLFERLAAGR